LLVSLALKDAVSILERAGVDNPALDAGILASFCLDVERYRLDIDTGMLFSPEQIRKFNKLIRRRAGREPIAYITGSREFYSLEFTVNKNVLIPRPETELLVDLAIYYAPQGGAVHDLCTGSGAVAVALKKNRPDLKVSASDISTAALAMAKKNALLNTGKNSVKFYAGDMFAPLRGLKFDVITANPPYVDPAKKTSLAPELAREPECALFSKDSGAAHAKRIIRESEPYLNPGGIMILEIDGSVKDACAAEAAAGGYDISFMNDYAGLTRIALLKRREL
jgi:release factor glutamine methyltransferase